MRITIKSTLAGAAALLLASAATASAQTYNLTLCGASPGGLWSLLGAGIDAAVKKSFPGSTITYQTSGGGLANVGLLDKGTCDLAIITMPKPSWRLAERLLSRRQSTVWRPLPNSIRGRRCRRS